MSKAVAQAVFTVQGSTTSPPTQSPSPPQSGSCTSQVFSIADRGVSLTCVKHIQYDLNLIMSSGLAVDGYYGPITEAAVKSFQSYSGITVDGIVGPQTWNAIEQVGFAAGPQIAENLEL